MIALSLDWQADGIPPGCAERQTARAERMAQAMPPAAHWSSGGALFVTQKAPRGWRPATTRCGGQVLFAGFLYHREDARTALGIGPASDAAIYAAAYGAWGDGADLRLLGEFAAIIAWPGQHRVRLSRSPLTAPPLHIWQSAERLIVGSSPRVMFAAGAPRQIDEQKIADGLFLNYCEEERSWFADIARLPAGARAELTPAGMRTHRYYDPLALPPTRLARDADYVQAASALLAQGTAATLDGFARPAISLSGGFDSQAVAAHALRQMPAGQTLLGLTGVPEAGWDGTCAPGTIGDERAAAAALGAMYPALRVETVDAAGLGFDHKLGEMFLLTGAMPRNTMNLHWIHAIHARARAQHCDVLLNGGMGNVSFSFDGSGALPGWLRHGHWLRLSREIAAIRGARSWPRTLWSQAVRPALPQRARQGSFGEWCPLNPDYARRMHLTERAQSLRYDPHFRAPASTGEWRRAALANALSESGDIIQGLEHIHGVPMRDPTFYRPLVEFCFSIPDDQYLRGGTSRWLARRMLSGLVPDSVLNAAARGVQAADWHLRLGRERAALTAELDRLAANPAMAARFDVPRMQAALRDWPQTTPHTPQEGDYLLKFALPRMLTAARFIGFVEGSNV